MKNSNRILLITHSTGIKGPGDFLEDYLIKKNHTVFKLEHPLDDYENRFSIFFNNKKEVKEYKRKNISLFNYLIDFYLSLKFVLFTKFDIFIGANNFDTLSGIIARKIFRKKMKKIIYFASDFSPERFNSNILNKLYFGIERIVLKKADYVISNTSRSEEERQKLGMDKKKSKVISNGVFIKNPQFKQKKINKGSFIYVGNVTREHGLIELLKVIVPLVKELTVVGQGDEWENLKDFIKEKKIKARLYYKKNHEFVMRLLSQFEGFGLAPYKLESWTYYSSPLKINEYIASGVPVITSNVAEVAGYIVQNRLGIVYEKEDRKEIEEKLERFVTDDYHLKAKEFYALFNYNTLYKKVPL